ncbi:hypothetical protein B5801_01690 [Gilliamella apicola]|nr:hypothetical protein B5801_01690 [Gilliamella apicola]
MLLFFTLTSQGYYDFMNYTIYYINNISYSYSFIMIRQQIHGLIENGGSFRNTSALDRQYNKFRKEYWKLRALDFM